MDNKEIVVKALEKAMNYPEYRKLVDDLLLDNMATGQNHSEAMLHYTKLNVGRMNKWDKHYHPSEQAEQKLKSLGKETWLIITEGWCGDAAHNMPVIAALSELNPQIDLKLVLRDQHLDLIDLYLTNGGRSIPKMIRFNENLEEVGSWGPRPLTAQEMVIKDKEDALDKEVATKKLQIWYARDRGQSLEKELISWLS